MQLFLRYIVGLIIKTSSSPELMEKERTYLNKLNLILVSILKRQLESLIFFNSSVTNRKGWSILILVHIQGVAKELGEFHPWHHRGLQDERIVVPEQHGDPQAAERGGVRLQLRPDDPDQGQALEGLDVLAVLGGGFRSFDFLKKRKLTLLKAILFRCSPFVSLSWTTPTTPHWWASSTFHSWSNRNKW